MSEYKLTWEIDLDADTPREAAEKAAEIFNDQIACLHGSLKPVFKVTDKDTGTIYHVDLSLPVPFPVEDWKYAVANGDTLLGYAEWVKHRAEEED